MNTMEVFKILERNIKMDMFLGVFPLDRLPPIKNYPAAIVVNLDASNEPGSHWVALYFVSKKRCDYFDSYGLEPPVQLKHYISDNALSFTYNNVQTQGLFSISCGHMCIYFLLCRSNDIPFKNIVLSMLSEKIYKYFDKLKL